MKIIDEIIKKYPQIKLESRVEEKEGFDQPFHTLYLGDNTIISILNESEPLTGKERKELFEIVDSYIKPYLPY